MWTPSHIPTSLLQTDNRVTHTECKTSDLCFFFTRPRSNITAGCTEGIWHIVARSHDFISLFSVCKRGSRYGWIRQGVLKATSKKSCTLVFETTHLFQSPLMIKGQISIFVSSEKDTGCGCRSGRGGVNASVLRVKTSQVAPSAGLCQHISLS